MSQHATDETAGPAWDRTAMRKAIDAFRKTGDPNPCLRLLGQTEADRRALPALQHALKRAASARERDAFEDIAFELGQPAKPSDGGSAVPRSELIERAAEQARKQYGQHLGRFVDVKPFLTGLLASTTGLHPVNLLAAAVGAEATARLKNPLGVETATYGQEVTVVQTDCPHCGGRGKILCTLCLQKALQLLSSANHVPGPRLGLLGTPGLAAEMLVQFPQRFGCASCRNSPVTSCLCARSVKIPQRPREGQIVKGRHDKTGEDCWFTLHLEEC